MVKMRLTSSVCLALLIGLVQMAQPTAGVNSSTSVEDDLVDDTIDNKKMSAIFSEWSPNHPYLGAERPGEKRNVKSYSFGLGKRVTHPSLYSFGLGKRADLAGYSINGRRDDPIDFFKSGRQLRGSAPRFGFGLGKRSMDRGDSDYMADDVVSSVESGEMSDDGPTVSKRGPLSSIVYPAYIRTLGYLGDRQLNRSPRGQNSFDPYDAGRLLGKRLPSYNFGLGK